MTEELRTEDIYLAGLAMARGLALAELEILPRPQGRHARVIFVLVGDGAAEVLEEYRAGRAEANVAVLKHSVAYLRRRLFAALGEEATR